MAAGYDGSIKFDTKIDTKGINNAKTTITKSMSSIGSSVKKIGAIVAAAFSVKAMVEFGKQAVQIASDLEEVQNVVDVAFGDMSDKVDAWAKTTVEAFGMSELKAKQFSSTYMAMGKGMGLDENVAANMAIGATERIADIASFYNKSFEEVDTMMKSIWTGETESLKRIGVVMTETNLQAFALSKGIKGNISDLDQATKTQLRYAYVMEQTRLAQGDFARTSDSWANQTRLLSENFNSLKATLGQGFIQALTPAIKYINILMKKLIQLSETFSQFTASLFGKQEAATGSAEAKMAEDQNAVAQAVENTADAQNDLTKATKKTNKEQKRTLANFDTLNRLGSDKEDKSSTADLSGLQIEGLGDIEGQIEGLQDDLDEAEEKMIQKIKNILKYVSILLGVALILIGIFTFNIAMILAGCALLALGLTLAKSDSDQKPTWVDMVISWGLMIVGVALLLIGIVTGNIPLMIAGFIMLVAGSAYGDASGATEKTPAWVQNIIKWGLMIVGVALLLIGLFSGNILMIIAGAAAIMLGFAIGGDSFKKAPVWVNQIITWGLMLAGVVMLIVGIATANIALIVAGAALLGMGIAYGIKSDAFKHMWEAVKKLTTKVWSILKEFWDTKLKKIFTKEFWAEKWNKITDGLKDFMNAGIGYLEKFINWIISGLNKLIEAVNKISIPIPGWLQDLTGMSTIGFNLKPISEISLPRLASGTVVPANYGEFAAILGDNKREAEVVSPVSTMKQAFKEAISEMGGFRIDSSDVYIDGQKIGRIVFDVHNDTVARTGRTPLKGV